MPEESQQRLRELISNYYAQVDGRNHERVSSVILEHAGIGCPNRRALRMLAYHYALRSKAGKVRDRLHNWLGRRRTATTTPWAKGDKFFDARTVQAMVEDLRRCGRQSGQELCKMDVTHAAGSDYLIPLSGKAVKLQPAQT